MIVENKKKRVIFCGVDLIPGVNDLDKKQTEDFLKEIETVERYQDLDIIEVLDKDVTKLDTSILDLPAKEITQTIKKTFHVEKLEMLIDNEIEGKNRSNVIRAMEKQIGLVHSKQKTDGDENEE